ncbi:MAG: 4Fe-4S binding protein [Acidobacteriota bacterium]
MASSNVNQHLPKPVSAPPVASRGSQEHKWRLDLLRALPPLKWIVKRRWFQFAVVLPNLLFFMLFLMAGVFGTPVGNRNIIIVFVWIFWWFLLISAMVPFASRIWCAVCPFPFFGEWLQRRALVRTRAVDTRKRRKGDPGVVIGRNRYFALNLRWPKTLSNIWIQNFLFLGLCTFSALFLTRPLVSVVVLGSLILTATALHLVYRQRAFCNYICPVSGFLSLYSMTSMLEVRSRDADVCAKCRDKGCLAGNDRGWGCPWFMYPSKMGRNNYCGLCMECVKTCPHDNMTLNLRPFCSDTRLKGYDEAWKAFIMLSLAITYSVVYLGPWPFLKDWSNIAESGNWPGFLTYASVLWAGALLLFPGAYATAVWAGRKLAGPLNTSAKDVFLGFTYSLVPLGLLAWVAFSLPLILVNGSYILMTLSDPFGWGWDLFATGHLAWTPVVPHWTPYIQVLLLLVGLHYALKVGYRHAERLFGHRLRAMKAFAPVGLLLTGCVIFFFSLYVG